MKTLPSHISIIYCSFRNLVRLIFEIKNDIIEFLTKKLITSLDLTSREMRLSKIYSINICW